MDSLGPRGWEGIIGWGVPRRRVEGHAAADAWKGTLPSCLAQLRRREREGVRKGCVEGGVRGGALAEESRPACSSRG